MTLLQPLPSWVEIEDDREFADLVKVCTEVLTEDELHDVLAEADLEEALGLVFSFLLEKGEDPEEYLIMQNFLQ